MLSESCMRSARLLLLLLLRCAQGHACPLQPMDIEGRERCKIASLSTGLPPNQKIIANRMADRVVYLERRMMGFAAALEQAHGISVSASLSVPCQACSL